MGLLDLVGAAFEGIGAFVGGAIGVIAGGIGAALGGIGIAIAKIAPMLGTIMSKVIAPILQALGMKVPENPQELGLRMEKSDKNLEDFDDVDEYLKYLDENVTVDEDELKNLSPERQAELATKGVSLGFKAIEEKTGVEMPGESVEVLGKISEGMDIAANGIQMAAVLKNLAEEGVKSFGDVSEYLKGGNTVDPVKIGTALEKSLGNAGISDPGKVIMDAKKCQSLEL